MHKEEEEFHQLESRYTQIENILENLSQNLESIAQSASSSDVVEGAEEKIEEANEKLEEAMEKLDVARERLEAFLELSAIATHLYNTAQSNPTNENKRKADTSYLKAEKAQRKFASAIQKAELAYNRVELSTVKAKSGVNIASINAQTAAERERSKKVRINFTLPETMKHDWKELADELSISVSQLVRNAMGVYESSIKNTSLNEVGRKIEKFGEDLESRIETYMQGGEIPSAPETPRYDPETGERIRKRPKSSASSHSVSQEEREKMKRRVTGLIRLQKSLPISKLAKALNITEDDAENLIYELAADGIDGSLDSGEFKFSKSEMDNVVKCVCEQIDKM
jgi:hypothetical protein